MLAEEVRTELRLIKMYRHKATAQAESQSLQERQLDYLLRQEQTPKVKSSIEMCKRILSRLRVVDYIFKADKLEEKYLTAIDELEPLMGAVLREHYLNDIPYWKIANRYHYCEQRVRLLGSKGIKELAEKLKESE